MAISYEIVLGFTAKDFDNVEKILGTNFRFDDERAYNRYFEDNMEKLNIFCSDLDMSHIKTLKEIGFEPINEKEFVFETPLGVREFSPFRIETYFDATDIGDKYEDIVIGVSLSGRYRPTLLDWPNKNGSLNTMVIDEKATSIIEIAKRNISEKIPIFKSAKIIVKLRYY